jgi:preprotein translocase subunit SecB
MAEQEGANGAGDQAAGEGGILPQVGVIAQYVKDLSFENPNAPAVYQWQGQPQMDVQFNIGSQPVGPDVHEVVLKIDIAAKAAEGTAFQMELVYGGLFALRNIPEDQLQAFCSPRRRACSSRSPAGSSPTRRSTAASRR